MVNILLINCLVIFKIESTVLAIPSQNIQVQYKRNINLVMAPLLN